MVAVLPRALIWQRLDTTGVEQVNLADRSGLTARGTAVAVDPVPYACRYELFTDEFVPTTEESGPEEPQKALARKLLNSLQVDTPQQLETLIESFEGVSSSEVIAALFDLEMSGLVRQLPGKNFVKVW